MFAKPALFQAPQIQVNYAALAKGSAITSAAPFEWPLPFCDVVSPTFFVAATPLVDAPFAALPCAEGAETVATFRSLEAAAEFTIFRAVLYSA